MGDTDYSRVHCSPSMGSLACASSSSSPALCIAGHLVAGIIHGATRVLKKPQRWHDNSTKTLPRQYRQCLAGHFGILKNCLPLLFHFAITVNLWEYESCDYWHTHLTDVKLKSKKLKGLYDATPVSYTHLTLPTKQVQCRSRWSPYH